MMRPFLKWAGGKYRLVKRITEQLPMGERLLEPFAGSCALALNSAHPQFWLNDINPDLIHLYHALQRGGPRFMARCRECFIPENNCADRYYQLRDEFNRTNDPVHRSALFLYLNRHGYNGLSRYNAGGGFNVPFGRYLRPYFPEAELDYFYHKFRNARFTCCDFETVMRGARPGDVVYCDPPYIPLTATSNFTTYSAGGFGREEQIRLARVAADVSARGIPVIISNHYSDFTLEIYQNARIESFPVRRFISCDGANRNEVRELLAIYSGH